MVEPWQVEPGERQTEAELQGAETLEEPKSWQDRVTQKVQKDRGGARGKAKPDVAKGVEGRMINEGP